MMAPPPSHLARASRSGPAARSRLARALQSRFVLAAVGLGLTSCDRSPVGPAPCCPVVRGITLVDWTRDGYGTPRALDAVRALAASGANTMVLVVTAYQPDSRSPALRDDDPRTPAPESARAALEAARAVGLDVVIKPHVDVDDGTWRGHIEPSDPAVWFDSYRSFLLPWAALAESLGSPLFVVGTELASTIGEERRWRETIDAVRSAFAGRLAYAASWDEAERVPFWDALDLAGVDFYFPVTARESAGRFEILAGWQPWIERLAAFQHRVGRPILLTEIGYRSIDGAGMRPFDAGAGGRIDLGEQADLYWAALQATAPHAWISGLVWWNWRADGAGGPEDADYTPRGKPAESELVAAWGAR